MLGLFLAAVAAASPTAVDAERAFAREAQRSGQWTAFRKYADPDAVMFNPQAVWAHEFLAGKADPPVSVRWSPNVSFVSCDGRTAVNTGPWTRPKSNGHFTTVWMQDKGQWKWVYDAGQSLQKPLARRSRPIVRNASCDAPAPGAPLMKPPSVAKKRDTAPPDDFGRGQSADRTLGWDWKVEAGGTRTFRAFLWTGQAYELAVYQKSSPE